MNYEQERAITCRANKPVEFTWDGNNMVSIRRVDLNALVVPEFSFAPAFFVHRFYCSDCPLEFGCIVENTMPETARITSFKEKGLKKYRPEAFQNLTLEPDVDTLPRIKKQKYL